MSSGQSVQITCYVSEGDLPLRIVWQLNGKRIEDFSEISSGVMGKRGSFLTIDSVSYNVAGNYSCAASNAAGEDVHTAQLLVNGYFLFIKIVCSFVCRYL